MIATGTARTVPAAFARLRPSVDGALRDAVGRLTPELRRPVAHHLGWPEDGIPPPRGGGGKALRPTLALLCAEALGSDPGAALPGAVAVELVHDFSLLHDDLMDGDRERRHRPTVWARYGPATAVIAGDALAALAQRLLLEGGGPAARRAAAELASATAEMIDGQAQDLAFETRPDVTLTECLAMSERKTAALLGCAGALGALLAGGSDTRVRAVRAFGRHLGLAFQAVDDLLGVWGDPARTGKPAAGDLRRRKKTLPVVHALSAGGVPGDRLRSLLTGEELDEATIARAVDLLEAAGSRRWVEDLAERSLGAALDAISRAALLPGPAAELEALARFVTERDF